MSVFRVFRGRRAGCCAVLAFACSLSAAPAVGLSEPELEQQRQQFLQAREAWRQGQRKTYQRLLADLQEYPLYPYLRYQELKGAALRASNADLVRDFLARYPDFIDADTLRRRWLEYLAARGDWQAFLQDYSAGLSVRLDCLWLQARIEQDQTESLAQAVIPLFLSGRSQPAACDPAFDWLYRSEQMSSDLLWQRLYLALEQDQLGLVHHLGGKLDPAGQQLLQQWIQVHLHPERHTRAPDWEDTPERRRLLLHGLQRLGKQHPARALQRWDQLRARYRFTEQERHPFLREWSISAVRRREPQAAAALLDQIRLDDQELFDWALRAALRTVDWTRLERWTRAEPPEQMDTLKWRYWHGRAQQKLGRPEQALAVFQTIADQRDYYGFLAADHLGRGYAFNHQPVPADMHVKQALLALPVIQRAREWLLLEMKSNARREWFHALNVLERSSPEWLPGAARLVASWDWLDRAIFTLGRARFYDDLELRFPVLFEHELREYADLRGLDPGWIFGLVRAESAFIEDARSPAGALGLMQVMPQTGQLVARKIQWRNFDVRHLLQAEVNIPIGSAYLQQMMEYFGGDKVLSTAAYNAGPGRVRNWLRRQACVEPDIWIETIPFNETRKYVKRVLFYASIYNWRLNDEITPIRERMAGPDCFMSVAGPGSGQQRVSQDEN